MVSSSRKNQNLLRGNAVTTPLTLVDRLVNSLRYLSDVSEEIMSR